MFRTQYFKISVLVLGCALLFGLARYVPVEAAAKTYYVATTGSDSNPGTEALPFATLQKAVDTMVAGDTTLVKNGTYTKQTDRGAFVRFTRSGTADAWITLKAYPGHLPKIVSTVLNAVLMERVSYVEVSGFQFQGVSTTISKDAGNGFNAKYSHHIVFRNNDVYDFPGGGIGTGWSDYIVVENNKVHNTSKLSTYATSAISLYQLTNVDTASGYHNIIRGNIVYDNANTIGKITDGNCIIIDSSRHPDANNVPINPYTGRTLIENNVCFNNGGRGIHVFRSDYAYVTHNTLYMNQYTTGMDGSELSALYSGNSEFYNNIVYTRPGKIANNAWKANNVQFGGNLYFNAAGVNPRAANDIVGVDPQFVAASTNPATANFRLKSTSPAINKSIGAYFPVLDLDKNTRPSGSAADLGAYEFLSVGPAASTATPTPQPSTPQPPTPTPPPTPTGPALLLNVSPANAAVGQAVTVNLQMKAVANVYGLDVKCSVNPAVLSGGARTDGAIFKANNSFFVDGGYKTDGWWAVAASLLNPAPAFSGDGVAFTLGYIVAGAGMSEVACNAVGVDRDGRSLALTVVKGAFSSGTMVAPRDALPAMEPVAAEIVPMDSASDPAALIAPAAPVTIPASVSGLAAYQNRAAQSGIIVRLFSGETALAELVTNADGGFNFTDVPDGTYSLHISAPGSLTAVANVTISGGQAVGLPVVSLPSGDADGSSLIDLSDAALIGANFRLTVPPAPASADLNGDGEINIADLVLVGSNYGSAGPVTVATP